MAKTRKRRAGRPKKAKAKRGKKQVKARGKTKRNVSSRKKKTTRRKRTTAQGMRRALRMKQAADQRKEEMQQPVTQTPMPAPVFIEPDPIPHNIREQGDVANIIQNTTNRRAG